MIVSGKKLLSINQSEFIAHQTISLLILDNSIGIYYSNSLIDILFNDMLTLMMSNIINMMLIENQVNDEKKVNSFCKAVFV